MSNIEKVAIIGLDCGEPSLFFERWIDDLPNIRKLMDGGMWGRLESCMPPITVPAWSCMATSKDPGTLGVYGFRNRSDWSYEKLNICTNVDIHEPRVWDILATTGKKAITVGIPQTFPILRPPNGHQITCFLTPDINSNYTHPPELKKEVAELVGEYMLDVKGFRTDNKKWLLEQIYEMTERRFKVCAHLIKNKPWDLFWMVEMGTDRIHHGFWQYIDNQHHRYEKGNPFENSVHDYYVYLDKKIGELLALFDRSKTAVWVVSDHGAKRMDGGICFNDWLIKEGYLFMKTPVKAKRKFEFSDVDWTRTRAWGEGGYYGRLFINKAGREPNGLVKASEYDALRDELTRKIEALPDDKGRAMGTRVYKPEKIYAKVNKVPPDLIVIFGDLHWRSVGAVGNPSIYTFENDTGPDDANHAQFGMYILNHASIKPAKRDASLYDVTPTVLKMFNQKPPADMKGKPLI